jgi:xylulokinase
MTIFLGIDLGTSSVKAVLVDGDERVLASAAVPLATAHPAPLAAEQEPADWWRAVESLLGRLADAAPREMARLAAIGLSGQMHAAVLVDRDGEALRAAPMWNDGRAYREAEWLKESAADLAEALGVPPSPSFTAPKLLWLRAHEPALLARAATLLLPKDFIRLRLTGERATDVSDAAGTWLLDEAARTWSAAAVDRIGLDPALLPPLYEGSAVTGTVRPALARRFGLPEGVVVAGGAGDTPAGGIGIGAVEEGRAFMTLGTSASLFVANAAFRPAPRRFVHAFCHGVPDRWYQMAALLNGASVAGAVAGLTGAASVEAAVAEAEAAYRGPGDLLMLPYLAGERTPHDDPHAKGAILGLTPSSTRADVVLAALEGVAFSFADAVDALAGTGTRVEEAGLIGGGARSRFWGRLLASVLGLRLKRYADGASGPALGAARLARLACGADAASVLREPPVADVIEPDPGLTEGYAPRIEAFRALYRALRPEFRRT